MLSNRVVSGKCRALKRIVQNTLDQYSLIEQSLYSNRAFTDFNGLGLLF